MGKGERENVRGEREIDGRKRNRRRRVREVLCRSSFFFGFLPATKKAFRFTFFLQQVSYLSQPPLQPSQNGSRHDHPRHHHGRSRHLRQGKTASVREAAEKGDWRGAAAGREGGLWSSHEKAGERESKKKKPPRPEIALALPAASRALPPSFNPRKHDVHRITAAGIGLEIGKGERAGLRGGVKPESKSFSCFLIPRIAKVAGLSSPHSSPLSRSACPPTPLCRPLSAATGRAHCTRGGGGEENGAEGAFLGPPDSIRIG